MHSEYLSCSRYRFYSRSNDEMRIWPAVRPCDVPDHDMAKIAGVTLTCTRSSAKSGVIAVTVTPEDSIELSDVVVFPKVHNRYGSAILGSPGLVTDGQIDRRRARGGSITAEEIQLPRQGIRIRRLARDGVEGITGEFQRNNADTCPYSE